MFRFNIPIWKMRAGYFSFSYTLTDHHVVSFVLCFVCSVFRLFCVEAVTTYLGISLLWRDSLGRVLVSVCPSSRDR
jgi:hypothetical protein